MSVIQELPLQNQPLIDYLSIVLGHRNMAPFVDDISSYNFNPRGVNYCVLLKSSKGHTENWF